jgi:hypothetical protein
MIDQKVLAEHVALTQTMVDDRRQELVDGLRADVPPDYVDPFAGHDWIPALPSADDIGPSNIDLRVTTSLGSTARTIRPGQIVSGVGSPLDRVAAMPTIEVDVGTISFIYDFARGLGEFVTEDGTPVPITDVPDTLASVVNRMRYATDWYVSRLPLTGVLPLGEAPLWRKEWAVAIATAAERFVIAHELGHAILHAERGAADDEERRAREQEADLFGLRVVLAADREEENPDGPGAFAYAGALFYLAIMELAEAYTDHRYSDVSHPHAGDRLGYLSLTAPGLGLSLRQVQLAIAYVDTTLNDLANAVWGERPTAPDPQHPPKTYADPYIEGIRDAVLYSALGQVPIQEVTRLILAALQERPSVTVAVVRDLYLGQMRHPEVDTVSYVQNQVFPALPDTLRTDLLAIIH